MYSDVPTIIKPVVGNVYVVKGFSKNGGFLLETIDNPVYRFVTPEGNLIEICEPGFAVNRFEPAKPLSKKKIVNIEIKPQVEERLYIPKKKKSKEKVKDEELELA